MTDPVIKPEHRELAYLAVYPEAHPSHGTNYAAGKPALCVDNHELLARVTAALASLEATVESRVRLGLAELLSAVDAMVNGFVVPGQTRERTERELMGRLVAARSKFPYPCAKAESGTPCPGAKEEQGG
jgi:hypothetical protein